MFEMKIEDLEDIFPSKNILTMEEVASALNCPKRMVANWTRRPELSKRPPMLRTGKWIRFPKRPLLKWLIECQFRKDTSE